MSHNIELYENPFDLQTVSDIITCVYELSDLYPKYYYYLRDTLPALEKLRGIMRDIGRDEEDEILNDEVNY